MFQFLIGTLKTSGEAPENLHGGVFQFLIGTLKTATKKEQLFEKLFEFQFLIGTLKTLSSLTYHP